MIPIALDLSCVGATKNVGDYVKIRITITNQTSSNIPEGIFVFMNFPEGGVWATYELPYPILPGADVPIHMIIESVPTEWAGKSMKFNVVVYENNETYENDGAPIVTGSCPNLLTIGDVGEPVPEITKMEVI